MKLNLFFVRPLMKRAMFKFRLSNISNEEMILSTHSRPHKQWQLLGKATSETNATKWNQLTTTHSTKAIIVFIVARSFSAFNNFVHERLFVFQFWKAKTFSLRTRQINEQFGNFGELVLFGLALGKRRRTKKGESEKVLINFATHKWT